MDYSDEYDYERVMDDYSQDSKIDEYGEDYGVDSGELPFGVMCQDGLLLPLIRGGGHSGSEYTMVERLGLVFLFLAILLYLFICIAYLSETMMVRLEKLTSTWNKTVANFTLLSFGTGAPQMLLMFYELSAGNNFSAGNLGVSTILGSAAYKVLITIGFCMFFVPNTGINNVRVFIVSSIISMFSFILLPTIVTFISEGEVEIGEAVVLMLPYPFVVVLLYLTDRFCNKKRSPTEVIGLEDPKQPTDSEDNLGEESTIEINNKKSEKVWKLIRLISMPWSFIFDITCKNPCCNIVLTFIAAYLILMPIHIILLVDVASQLGCYTYLQDWTSGILLITLGFCIPSNISARNSIKNGSTVDDIIAKMIGSNIISVFLGIGLPWLIAAAYHKATGTEGGFQFPPGSLAFTSNQLNGYLLTVTLMLLIGGIVNCGGHGKLQNNKIWRIICGICFILFWVTFVVNTFLESYVIIN